VLQELLKMEKVILFIDEIHAVVGAGAVSGGGSMDASTILKPVLTSGKLRCIGSTTYEDYRKYFDRDRALTRRFQKIEISEPTVDETYKILAGLKDRYEEHHGLVYTDEALHAAAELSAKYINDRYLPDKAIDVIDEAGAYLKLFSEASAENGRPVVTAADIERVVAKIAKIPEKSVSHTEGAKLMDLERELKSMIFGQDKAIELVVHAIKRSRAGFHKPDKPVASLLFVGPTGVGKTELARQLAAFMSVPLHRFDMSEYQEKHTVSRLVGAPPGYVGYDEGGLLTEAVRKNPHSVLLLDEIEKAHQDIFNTLLQVFDYATLTDNNGKKADFRNVVIIMTSNAGAREIGKPLVGFGERNVAKDAIDYAVENIFSPEFRNRLDAVVTFNNLNDEIMRMIVRKEIREFQAQLVEKKVTLKVDDGAVGWLAAKGFSSLYGAREIARLFQDKVKNYFVDAVLFGALASGGTAIVSVKDDDIAIESRPGAEAGTTPGGAG
jgi:ATP-dependent Clp protease ATP-binding subunit ClpA